ncbi:hypothetical protein HOY80DRAFT_1010066 [Tuber brumale]|nr:hypothetical protein HOY80DRAFT_1010066 [Tuber brumale]
MYLSRRSRRSLLSLPLSTILKGEAIQGSIGMFPFSLLLAHLWATVSFMRVIPLVDAVPTLLSSRTSASTMETQLGLTVHLLCCTCTLLVL